MKWAWLCGLTLSASASAFEPTVTYSNTLSTPAGTFVIESTSPDPASRVRLAAVRRTGKDARELEWVYEASSPDPDQLAQLTEALETAAKSLSRWGGLTTTVHLRVVPSHAALEDAANRVGFSWLRAWARYDDVIVQAPETWAVLGASQSAVNELLTHELTHCVMYQRIAGPQDWTQRTLPLWFREGMASVSSGQGHRWLPLEKLARFETDHPGMDPLRDGSILVKEQSLAVYSAAHHAFAFLLEGHGDEAVRALLEEMAKGRSFDAAFQDAMNESVEQFERTFTLSLGRSPKSKGEAERHPE